MATFFTGPSDVPPEPSVLEATKRAAGFGETVVQVFGDRSIIWADTIEVCKLPHRVEWVAVDGDLGRLYTACREFW